MKKLYQILVLVGVLLFLVGAVLFCVAMTQEDWDFSRLSDTQVEQITYTEPTGETYDRVELCFANSDVEIIFEECDTLTLEYPKLTDRRGRAKNEVHLTKEENGITVIEEIFWYRNWLSIFNFADPKVKLHLPKDRVWELSIFTDNGEILVETNDQKGEDGKVLTDGAVSHTKNFHISSDNGDVFFLDTSYLVCDEHFSVHTDSGDVQLGVVHAGSLYVETDNGEVGLWGGEVDGDVTLLSDNGDIRLYGALSAATLEVTTSNGEIIFGEALRATEVTVESNNGGIYFASVDATVLTIESDNGDVQASLVGNRPDYSIDVETDNGDANVEDQISYSSPRVLRVETDNGDIDILFLGNAKQ